MRIEPAPAVPPHALPPHALPSHALPPHELSVLDLGAVGDGTTDDTAAVQAAIDTLAARGGGRVVLPAGGVYRCGSVRLRDRIELHLPAGARLAAATDPADFSRSHVVGALSGGLSTHSAVANGMLLWAEDATDIAITGAGTVDGSAAAYVVEEGEQIHRMRRDRPFPLFLIGCTGVVIRDVRFTDAALWTMRLSGCTDVRIDGVRIANDMRVPNADGIDIDHCRRVRITGCDIVCPDDGISLKTSDEFVRYGPCEDVVVSACTVTSRSTAITVGADTEQPLRNVVVTGCVIRDSHRGVSVSVGTGTGGYVENVLFSDLVIETRHDVDDWWGCGEPILLRSAPWHREAGAIRHVRVRNVLARSENGIVVHATAPGAIEDVVIGDVRLELTRWTDHPGRRQDLRPITSAEPFPGREWDINGLRPALPPAVLVEGARDVRLRDVRITVDPAHRDGFGPVLEVRDSADVTWRDLHADDPAGPADALLHDGAAAPLPSDGAA
ncbi:hypothetical protein LO771_14515 [Streptacidiphilus sp. ASG 303]|uniref:glycoside hydrolase family 28 protein n=1 Tax=Streptacidiphilus sp. ASG 303 TaxID=2896847 RepID=UPI001E375E6D|nr:glycosyl hydrolase family 28 protein [Streptacidiphilus sp. ASG 303]MCD0483573.1 hypothetical protein [Streptacidiphilus sp. ASG 303]